MLAATHVNTEQHIGLTCGFPSVIIMKAYLKTFLMASVGVALVSVAIQVVTIRYSSEISKVLHAYPSLNLTSETLKSAFPIQKLLLSLYKYFPSIRNLPFLQPVSESFASTKSKKVKEKLFTSEQLKKFDGKDESKGPYLSILGRVYNVRKGKKHYGPGGGYEFFSGVSCVCMVVLLLKVLHVTICIRLTD